jgi:hypothetical protein
LAIFEPANAPHHWQPSALSAGPFAGLQGGAVASLLTAEIEAQAGQRNWGTAISASAWFLRPTPMAELRTQLSVSDRRRPRQRGRQHALGRRRGAAQRHGAGDAVARACVEISGFADPPHVTVDPLQFPLRAVRAAHGRPWFMDAMEARTGDGVAWFRLNHTIIEGAGPLSSVLGPADWTHGIARPFQNVVADPNPNLTVQLFRKPEGTWVGVRSETRWRPSGGIGTGSGVLLDKNGEIGRVSMSVVLLPFPKAEAAKPRWCRLKTQQASVPADSSGFSATVLREPNSG